MTKAFGRQYKPQKKWTSTYHGILRIRKRAPHLAYLQLFDILCVIPCLLVCFPAGSHHPLDSWPVPWYM